MCLQARNNFLTMFYGMDDCFEPRFIQRAGPNTRTICSIKTVKSIVQRIMNKDQVLIRII
jgi:hypothetical protein